MPAVDRDLWLEQEAERVQRRVWDALRPLVAQHIISQPGADMLIDYEVRQFWAISDAHGPY